MHVRWREHATIGSLSKGVFERHTTTRKWGIFPFKAPWRYQICITNCLYYHRDDLSKNLGKNHRPKMKKGHFRLTSVAQKRCCLSSLMTNSSHGDTPLFNGVPWMIIYICEAALIITGTLITVCIFWKIRKRLKRTSYLLINVTIADITVGIALA